VAGRPPDELLEQFAEDTHLYTSKELCEKYGRSYSAICDWRSYARDHGYDVGFGPEPEPDEEPTQREPANGGRAHFSANGNTATAWSKSERITTLDQLLKVCGVDLDVWKVDRYLVNKWEVGAKPEWKDLTWQAGAIVEGHIHAEGLIVEPLFQVKAWLVRREPEPVQPVIAPIECRVSFNAPPQGKSEGIQRALVLCDPHFGYRKNVATAQLKPFHDRRAIDLALQIAAACEPDRIDWLGDIFDMAEWSTKFLKSPEFYWVTQPALLEAHWTLTQFRMACPSAIILLYEGNHDDRLRRAMLEHLPVAYGLRAVDQLDVPVVSFKNLLALDALGIEWVGHYPQAGTWLNDELKLAHGERLKTADVVRRSDVVEINGHSHRLEWTSRTRFPRGKPHSIFAFSAGCLCHIDGRVPSAKAQSEWQQGCAVVDYDSDGNMCSVAPVLFNGGKAMWNGRVFEARDRRDDLGTDLPDWNWG